MNEEFITLNLVRFLKDKNWKILAYDFPQSGTGLTFHPNNREFASKNKGMINPDIIAYKNNTLLFFENKVDFFKPDIQKLELLKEGNYSDSLDNKLPDYSKSDCLIAVGLYLSKKNIVKLESELVLDFFFTVDDKGNVNINDLDKLESI